MSTAASLPPREPERIEALRHYSILDTPPDPALDDLTALAAEIAATPIAAIALVDERREWLKSAVGLALTEIPRAHSFVADHLASGDVSVWEHTPADARCAGSPLAADGVCFIAGAPLATGEGEILGALYVADRVSRKLTEVQRHALIVLARQAMQLLELRRQGVELSEREMRLGASEARIQHLNRVYAVLTGINKAILREPDPDTVVVEACRIAVEVGGFRMAAYITENEEGTPRVVAHAGADATTLAILQDLLDHDSEGRCWFTEHALRTGEHAVCNEIASDPRTLPWRSAALERQYLGMVALPIIVGGETVGAFNLYASETDFFSADEMVLLDELARDVAFALDLHRREQARAAADERRRIAEDRFRLVVENIQEAFWIANVEKTEILYASPAYETIFQRSRLELYAKPADWLEAIHPDDRQRVADAAAQKQRSGEYNEVYRIIRPDGSQRWVRDRAFPVKNVAGRIELIVGTATDITDQVQLEEQLRQSQKMESLGRLAGGVAHDFNNLLTIIGGMADLALSDITHNDPLRSDLEQIRLASARAAALTRQLLAMSRQQILEPTMFDMRDVVGGLRGMLQRLLGEDIVIELQVPDRLGTVRADPRQIEQVILNLAVNARDAMPDGGTLTMALAEVPVTKRNRDLHLSLEPGPYVTLTVTDTGHGMTRDTRERLFEPFFTTKGPGRGTGLGLATAYGIVQQSGGSIGVESELNRGARFTVYLPRVDGKAERLGAVDATQAAGGSETILVVEDEPALRAITRRMLMGAGYTVLEAGTGDEALALVARYEGPLDLLLTDVVLPGMNGRQLSEQLVRVRPQTRVLFMSGYTDDAILRHGVLEEPTRFVSKPFTPSTLRRRVREALDSPAAG